MHDAEADCGRPHTIQDTRAGVANQSVHCAFLILLGAQVPAKIKNLKMDGCLEKQISG